MRISGRLARVLLLGPLVAIPIVALSVEPFPDTPSIATSTPDPARAQTPPRGGFQTLRETSAGIEEPIHVLLAAPTPVPELSPVADPAPTAQATSLPTPDPTTAVTVAPGASAGPQPAPQAAPPQQPATPVPTLVPLPVAITGSTAELRTLALMNGSRAQAGIGPLALDAGVSITARAHSAAESRVGYVYHDGPDGTAQSRDAAACGTGWYGENTGKVWDGNVDALHSEFMAEPLTPINHHTNIVDPNFRRVGIGAVQGPDALYLTMVFCR